MRLLQRTEIHRFPDSSFFLSALLITLLGMPLATVHAAKCLFISSYQRGYPWSNGIEQGLRSVLDDHCELLRFYMNTKQHKGLAYAQRKAREAKELIESWQPDVVITADDKAAKYVIVPYFRDSTLPFVFCGVNWSAADYGFPYRNVTGMVEVAPIQPLLEEALRVVAPGRKAFYIGPRTYTEEKNLKRFRETASRLNIALETRLVANLRQWLAAYHESQHHDFVILGNYWGIDDWDDSVVRDMLRTSSRRFSITNHRWMMPYAMFGLTKVAEEQGEWAAKTALAILEGIPAIQIPIVANRKWEMWVNEALLQAAGVKLPDGLWHNAKRVRSP